MKIAIMGPIYTKKYFGGVATFDENLAVAFSKLGHEVVLYTNQKEIKDRKRHGIDIKKINMFVAKHEEVDLVLASLTYIRYFISFKAKIKVYFLHGYFYMPEIGLPKTFAAVIYQKLFLKYADYIISNSEFTSFMNYEAFNIKTHNSVRLAVSYDFIEQLYEAKKESVERKTKTLLFTGRLIGAKYIENILAALNRLKNEGKTDYKLIIVGEGTARKQLEEYVIKYGLNVEFVGRVSQKEIVKYYVTSDIFISLNPSEPFGITFCEALLAGCKIICPKTGGQSEYLKEYSDRTILVNEKDADEVALAIEELTVKKNMNHNISTENFTYERTAKEILKSVNLL